MINYNCVVAQWYYTMLNCDVQFEILLVNR